MRSTPPAQAGKPYPLGASWDREGVNFAVFAPDATAVEVCLVDKPSSGRESVRIALARPFGDIWHVYVPGLGPGQLYGLRADGPFDPSGGHRFNPHKLLFDPYARAVGRPLRWSDEVFGYPALDGLPPSEAATDVLDDRDSAACAPVAAVVDGDFDWQGDRLLETPWADTVIYEAHVKGFSRLNSDVPEELRGTYAGLGSAPAIDYLTDLGVTAVELLPVQHFLDEPRLEGLGLSNYWGYNTLGFFAPEPRYAHDPSPAGCLAEFKTMVRALHAAGIEVLLDVVYNHTGEGNHRGPTVCLRGLANARCYRLDPLDRARYLNYTGTGNTLDAREPFVVRMILDSLRYWVEQMHVDGFRFDLATVLGRESDDFDSGGGLLDAIAQDPVLSKVKLIAEPWDIGYGGYQVGGFPTGWAEWNGKYRDQMRSFWRGDSSMLSPFATRLAGSSDIYGQRNRAPWASVNFITAHDGFTLNDLVSYERKHNLDNGEFNRDGDDHNHSANHGAEGPTDDRAIEALRARQRRNFFASLLLSAGTPMIAAGDEIARTQQGNNNGYAQDNTISWLDWELTPEKRELLAFVRRLIRFRRDHRALRRNRFFSGAEDERGFQDIAWFDAAGAAMADSKWAETERRQLGVLFGSGNDIGSDPLFYLVNAAKTEVDFEFPQTLLGSAWERVFDTSLQEGGPSTPLEGPRYRLLSHASALFQPVSGSL